MLLYDHYSRVITLNIDTSKRLQTTKDCLETHRLPEHLDDENRVLCEACCEKTTRSTQVLFQRVPPVLILQLQRLKQSMWTGRIEKIDSAVQFPHGNTHLDMTMNMFVRDEAQRVLYELVAVCSHLGSSIDVGHYIAYVRHPEVLQPSGNAQAGSNRWLKIDDDVVSVLDAGTFESETISTAYLLFYSRVVSI